MVMPSIIVRMSLPGEPNEEPAAVSGGQPPEPVLRLKADAVDWREVEGQVVALDRAGSMYLAISRSGAVLWPAIVEGATRARLVQILLDNFDVEPIRAGADVEAFVAELSARHLLEPSG